MRFLLDMPISPGLAVWLREQGHDVVHAAEIGLARATDMALLKQAQNESRVVITADLDLGRLLALAAAEGPGVILIRGGSYAEAQLRELIGQVLEVVRQQDLETSMTVVDKRRLRRTQLPLRRAGDSESMDD